MTTAVSVGRNAAYALRFLSILDQRAHSRSRSGPWAARADLSDAGASPQGRLRMGLQVEPPAGSAAPHPLIAMVTRFSPSSM